MKKKVNEANVEMDVDKFNKVRGKLKPTDKVSLTDKKPTTTTTTPSSSSMSTVMEVDAVIEPQDSETIKYLSNVKDENGQVSKPFVIDGKNYQMVRGITPSKEIVMAVYCHDDVNDDGVNIIHPIDYFEENCVKPFLARTQQESVNATDNKLAEDNYDFAGEERKFHDKEAFMDYLNLTDLVGFKHFFVNIKTGVITAKFKNTKEMIKSGVKLGPEEDYMDVTSLKRFRFGDYFKNDMNEDVNPADAGTDIPKLQSDVKKLANLIKTKFSTYLSKLDKPIEQAQFLTAMAAEIGVPLNKLNTIITSYKDIAQDGGLDKVSTAGITAERKILTKNKLIESLKSKKVIKTIKIKDIK